MIDLTYSLVIEATDDPDFFGFYSPDLAGFTGSGRSIADCLRKVRPALAEHVAVMREQNMIVPNPADEPTILIRNQQTAKFV